jgi:hypothetical protein
MAVDAQTESAYKAVEERIARANLNKIVGRTPIL